ncbi:transporter [Naasia lichenicola]|uniref:Transporter n=1 Tax=Naasia lichenicola TaxID=2565933 RepID=A0A4S4FUL2_9MICO|nr:transporter [Naasia lichenicola]THG33515.1 transporter [Naasia lichenicola]
MVATLVRLRFLVLGNGLRRSPWQLVAFIFGVLYGLGALTGIGFGLLALSAAPLEIARTVVVIAGSVVVLAWILVPMFAAGIDQTLDTSRLVTFPIPLNTLLAALGASAILGIPGIITVLASIATAGTWWRQPGVAVVAILCGLVGALTCIAASRTVSTIASTVASGRRFREVAGVLVLIPLILLGPIISSAAQGIRTAADALPRVADTLAWTPLGAIWAVPSDLAGGDAASAALHALIGAATLVVLVFAWRLSLAVALITPPHAATRSERHRSTGLLGIAPATVWGAIAARSLIYWFRDPRYLRQLILIPLIPALLVLYSNIFHNPGLLIIAGPVVAFLLSLSIFADISFDGTAFATHLAAAVRGADDRLGRAVALAVFGLPAIVVVILVTAFISDTWAAVPATLGISLGTFLTGLGVSSVTSARLVLPVPAAGDSPFKSPQGANLTNSLATFVAWGILILLVLPELALTIVNLITGDVVWGWASLVVGVALGLVLVSVGIRIGGRVLDARGVDLLAQLRRAR